MTAVPPEVIEWVNTNFPKPRVDPAWLSDCYTWITSTLSLHPTTNLGAILNQITSQILRSDLRDSMLPNSGGLPRNIRTLDRMTKLPPNPGVMVQVMAVTEIGVSALGLKSAMEKVLEREGMSEEERARVEEDEGELDEGRVIPREMLKLELCDGETTVDAIEYRRIPELSLKTQLGLKIILKNTIVRRGIAFLEPGCITIKGGWCQSLEDHHNHQFLRSLELRLGRPDPGSPTSEPSEPEPEEQNNLNPNTNQPQPNRLIPPPPPPAPQEEEFNFSDDDDIAMEAWDPNFEAALTASSTTANQSRAPPPSISGRSYTSTNTSTSASTTTTAASQGTRLTGTTAVSSTTSTASSSPRTLPPATTGTSGGDSDFEFDISSDGFGGDEDFLAQLDRVEQSALSQSQSQSASADSSVIDIVSAGSGVGVGRGGGVGRARGEEDVLIIDDDDDDEREEWERGGTNDDGGSEGVVVKKEKERTAPRTRSGTQARARPSTSTGMEDVIDISD